MGILFGVGFALSAIFIFFVSRRYNFPALPSIFSHVLGFWVSALVSSAIFVVVMGEPSWLFTEDSSLLGGGLGWTVIEFAMIRASLKPIEKKVEGGFSSYKSKIVQHHHTMQVFTTMYGLGSLSVIIGSLCALIVHFFAFVMYGFIGIDLEMIPDRFVWVFRIPYILASMGVAYFIAWIYLGRKKSGVKFEPASKTQFDTATPQFSAVKLWTPNTIGFYTVFFGFPSGILLSSINWIRMGLNKKALYHLVAGLVGIFAIITILLIIPGNLGRGISGLINIGMAVYLNSQIKKDIAFFISNNREIQNAHWSWGCLISLLMVGFYFLLAMIVVMVLMFLGIPIPEQ